MSLCKLDFEDARDTGILVYIYILALAKVTNYLLIHISSAPRQTNQATHFRVLTYGS